MALEDHLKALDLCYFEMTEAFRGLADENVWRRPVAGLLSVGELAGHVAYWEAVRFSGEGEDGSSLRDLSNCKVRSPLLDPRFGYYTATVETSPTEEQLAMTGPQVLSELERAHREAMGHLQTRNPNLDGPAPYWPPHATYADLLRYVVFHVSYHTGQMYTVRHLLGETPPDN